VHKLQVALTAFHFMLIHVRLRLSTARAQTLNFIKVFSL